MNLERCLDQVQKRMLRDLSMMYHPDRPTGDSEMMAFVNEIKEYISSFSLDFDLEKR